MIMMAQEHVDTVIIHCSATPADMDIGVKEIDRWHRARGWLEIGYHFVITRSGVVQDGRKTNKPGAHALGWNNRSIGVCLVGGVDETGDPSDNFNAEQMNTLEVLIYELLDKYPIRHVMGHNEVTNKACPSFDVQELLKMAKLEKYSAVTEVR